MHMKLELVIRHWFWWRWAQRGKLTNIHNYISLQAFSWACQTGIVNSLSDAVRGGGVSISSDTLLDSSRRCRQSALGLFSSLKVSVASVAVSVGCNSSTPFLQSQAGRTTHYRARSGTFLTTKCHICQDGDCSAKGNGVFSQPRGF